MANRPRLLVIGPRGLFGYEGGIEKFTDAFVPRALNVADISVLCLVEPERSLPEGLEALVVPRSKRFRTDKALYLVYALFFHAIRRFDHIFIFGVNFAVLVPLLRLVFWRRSKIHLRSGSIDHLITKWGPIMRALMRASERLCRYADTIIAVAPSIRRHLLTLDINAHVVRNGYDHSADKSSQTQREPNTVLAVGRLTAQKNYGVLIEASHLMGPGGPQITVIGGADLSDESRRMKVLLSERPHAKVHFTGVQNRDVVLSALERKALYINCSIHEGMSNAVLEAVQQGISLILSDIEGNRDLGLADHFYFDPHDAVALAQKIQHSLSHPEDYIVSPEIFDDWDRAIDRILELTGVTP